MATGNRDVKLTLGVETTGAESVAELANDLKGVATAGKDAAPGVEKLAAELTALEQKTTALRTAEAAARAEVGLQKAARAELVDTLARLKAETDKAGKASADYAVRERQLRLEIIDSRAALRAKQTALESASTAARVAAAAEINLTAQIRDANAAYRAIGAAATASAAQQTTASASVGSGLKDLGAQLRTIQNLAGAAIGGSIVGNLVKDVAATADAYKNLAARVKIATGEGAAFDASFKGIAEVAARTNTNLETTGNLFVKLANAGKAIGLGNADALRLTESITQATQLSGASAESSAAAVTQLGQALASGNLRGDEFNSLAENGTRITKALSDGLGVTTGELRKLAEAGQLTSQVVIAALQGQAAALKSEFDSLPPTIGRAITNLSTAWTVYVGESSKAGKASALASQAINLLAGNLDTLATVLYSTGKAAVAYQALKLAQEFIGIGSAAKLATVEIAAMNAAQTASGAAGVTAAAGIGRFAGILSTLKVAGLVAVLVNLREIGTAIGEGAAKWAGYSDGVKEAALAAKIEADATAAQVAQKAAYAQKLQLAADKALGLSDISRKLIGDFDEFKLKGESTANALDKLAKSLELKDISGIANAATALDALSIRGKISAFDISKAFQDGLKGVDLGTFATNATAAFDGSEQGARRLKSALDAVALESLARAGTSVAELQGGFSKLGVSAINDVDALAKTLTDLGIKGDQAGKLLTTGLDKVLTLATTEKAVKAVEERILELGKKGLLTGDQIAAGLLKAREKADVLKEGINSVDEALSKFGIKSRGELTKTADELQQSYAKIVNATTVSLAEKTAAFEQYSKAAIAANGGVESSEVSLQREILRNKQAAEDAGKSIETSMQKAGAAVEAVTKLTQAQADAQDMLAIKYKLSADFTESQIALLERLAAASDKAAAAERNRLNVDKEGFSTNASGARVVATENQTQLDTRVAANYGADLAKDPRAIEASNIKLQLDLLRGSGGPASGTNSPEVTALLQKFTQLEAELAQARRAPQNGATTAGPAAAASDSAGAPSRTVNINLGGRSRAVGVSSQADSDVLVGVLRDLESAASRAA